MAASSSEVESGAPQSYEFHIGYSDIASVNWEDLLTPKDIQFNRDLLKNPEKLPDESRKKFLEISERCRLPVACLLSAFRGMAFGWTWDNNRQELIWFADAPLAVMIHRCSEAGAQ